ncbi:TPA: hypothetical protein CPT90_07795 [Candidatus Gastranaerophilales bacterium HUM_3]|nr:MAG TPA: hypothetical protein CPT90_07795 [Candidatus Gastranaerophilales bacterium HUM_3]
MKINTNLSSLIVQSSLKSSTKGLNTAIERMTTGFKINRAKDNAANFSINTHLSTKISGYQVAQDNTLQALDMLTTASDTLSTMESLVSRLRSLALTAGNKTYDTASLAALNAEAASIISELYRIKDNTTYNGIKLLESITDIPDGAGADVKSIKSKDGTFIKEVVKVDTSKMTKLSYVAEDAIISSGEYSISTAEELVKLSKMSNNSQIKGGRFVLANDIDMSAYSTGEGFEPIAKYGGFKGMVNGNGYVIRNLYINRPNEANVALIGGAHVEVRNLGLENVDITGKNDTGGIVGQGQMNGLINCYVKDGSIKSNGNRCGGIAGSLAYTNVDSCWTDVDVRGYKDVGGLIGDSKVTVKNSYALGDVFGNESVGGLIGVSSHTTLNCFAEGDVTASGYYAGGLVGYANTNYGKIENCSSYGFVTGADRAGTIVGRANGTTITNVMYNKGDNEGVAEIGYGAETTNQSAILGVIFERITNIQVGINSSNASNISIALGVSDISLIDSILGCIEDEKSIFQIDKVVNLLAERQVQIGSVQNRLLSVLEEINTKQDNLISMQSTIRDADIAEVSSEYIRQQILQQAAATLLATANQTPAIAIQLL